MCKRFALHRIVVSSGLVFLAGCEVDLACRWGSEAVFHSEEPLLEGGLGCCSRDTLALPSETAPERRLLPLRDSG